MILNNLMALDANALTEKQENFKNLHLEILANGNASYNYALNMATKLKEMKDSELFFEAGFSSFTEYAEIGCGLKERQAYNYINVVENLDKDFLQANAKLGISKLILLASAEPEVKDEIIKEDVSCLSTRELNKKLKEYQTYIKDLECDIEDKDVAINKYQSELETMQTEIKDIKEREPEILETVVEKTIVDDKRVKELEMLFNDSQDNVKTLKAKIKEIEASKKTVENKSELAKLKEDLDAITLQKTDLEKKLQMTADENVLIFKAHFDTLQSLIEKFSKLLVTMQNENSTKCKSALNAVIQNWQQILI